MYETTKRIKLQSIMIPRGRTSEDVRDMYYRSQNNVCMTDGEGYLLEKERNYDFFTYFNSVSVAKWKKYTHIEGVKLIIVAEGEFDIELFGHYKNKTDYKKEWFGRFHYSLSEKEQIVLEYPDDIDSVLIAFDIYAIENTHIYEAYYAAEIEESEIKKPYISLVTTTFKKESYVEKNIELLNEELFSDAEFKDYFCWNIIDNGRTLEPQTDRSKKIRILPNKNVGGAGGFSRGMIESLKQEDKPTHILLMDDDVLFLPESFKRLCVLLSIVKEEYKEHFVSGAMLKMAQPNIQHEDMGTLISEGYHKAVKRNLDLNVWSDIIDNETITSDEAHQYAAWWFCCIPVGIARLDNLPVPVFVRGDDVEYSLRNNARFITMNGLCIWHEGFEGKFSASLEYYQVSRNELAVCAMHPELSDVDVLGHIEMLFWEEMYKFDYKGASLLLDAIEDFMKGPEYFMELDGEQSMKDKKALDNKLEPITDEIRALIPYESLYEVKQIPSGLSKKVYDYSYNGQARIPEAFAGKKTGVIPYGWGYFPSKQQGCNKIIAVDALADKYVIYERSREKFKELKNRHDQLMSEYKSRYSELCKNYRQAHKQLTSSEFWDKYLKM